MSASIRSTTVLVMLGLLVGAGLLGAGMAIDDPGIAEPAAAQQAGEGEPGRTITVSGSGMATAEPDEALVRVTIETTADDPTEARRLVARNASSMRAALADLGLPTAAVRTTGYDIYQDRVRPPRDGKQPATIYRARHSFTIEVDDPDRVGSVIDTAFDGGATGVHGVQFTLEDATRDRLRNRATEAAMTDARGRAGAIAAAGDLTLTGVQSAQQGVGGPGPVRYLQSADGGAGGGTAIESGPVSVRATVTVTYTASG